MKYFNLTFTVGITINPVFESIYIIWEINFILTSSSSDFIFTSLKTCKWSKILLYLFSVIKEGPEISGASGKIDKMTSIEDARFLLFSEILVAKSSFSYKIIF